MKTWKCSVCGYKFQGERPPVECPQCSSTEKEFLELEEKEKLTFDLKEFDILLINGSTHKSHNTGIITEIAEEYLKKRKISYKKYNLNELNIEHCWCCYSMNDDACTYPCRNQFDDIPALHEMIIKSKAVIIASPINWNNMSARLKDFLDRLTCIQNLSLTKKKSLTSGKVIGILINGHEDGAVKTAMDIFLYFQQMGYVLAPFGFAYRTHGAAYNTEKDYEFFKNDPKLKESVEGIVNNVIETLNLEIEKRLKDKIKFVSE